MEMRNAVLSLVISLGISLTCGLLFATEVWDTSVRNFFNYTFLESNLLASSCFIGFSIGFDVAFLLSKLSPMWLCVIGCVGSTIGGSLLWSTTKAADFYSSNFWVTCLYGLLCGHSFAFLYHTAIYVCLKNFNKSRWGQIIGILHVPFGASPIIAIAVLNHYYSRRQNGEIGKEFLVFAIIAASVSLAAMFLLRIRKRPPSVGSPAPDVRSLTTDAFEYAPSDTGSNAGDTDDEAPIVRGSRDVTSTVLRADRRQTSLDSMGMLTKSEAFLSCDFQCLLWIFALGTAGLLTQLRNFQSFLQSQKSQSSGDITTCLLLFSVTTSVARVGSGVLGDICANRVPRVNFLLVGLLCHLTTGVGGSVIVENVTDIWVVLSVSGGLCYGLLWSVCPTVIAEKYGTRHFNALWSVLLVFSVLCSIVVQMGFVAIGDSFDAEKYSCDKNCIQLDVIVCTVLSLCALFLTCGLAVQGA